MNIYRAIVCALTLLASLASTCDAVAQTYPTKPVRILVGFPAGGNFDIVARLMGQWLSEQLHQPVIVDNRPGASTNIATEAAIRAPADGYTLLLGGVVNAANATLYEKLSFNFIRDVAPVAGVTRYANVMEEAHPFRRKRFPNSLLTRMPIRARSTKARAAMVA